MSHPFLDTLLAAATTVLPSGADHPPPGERSVCRTGLGSHSAVACITMIAFSQCV
jgi:hypothetical protein